MPCQVKRSQAESVCIWLRETNNFFFRITYSNFHLQILYWIRRCMCLCELPRFRHIVFHGLAPGTNGNYLLSRKWYTKETNEHFFFHSALAAWTWRGQHLPAGDLAAKHINRKFLPRGEREKAVWGSALMLEKKAKKGHFVEIRCIRLLLISILLLFHYINSPLIVCIRDLKAHKPHTHSQRTALTATSTCCIIYKERQRCTTLQCALWASLTFSPNLTKIVLFIAHNFAPTRNSMAPPNTCVPVAAPTLTHTHCKPSSATIQRQFDTRKF